MISIIRNNPRGDQVLSQKIYFVAMKFLVCLILMVRESVLKYFNITQHIGWSQSVSTSQMR